MRLAAALLALLAACASARAQAVTAAQLTTCKAALTALGIAPAGLTIFCPTNEAFAELADDMGFRGPRPVDSLLAAAKANPAVFRDVLSFHAVKGVVPAAAVKPGKLPTLLKGATVTVKRDGSDLELVHAEVSVDPDDSDDMDADGHGDEIVATDLTFEGRFARGGAYVVHAIDHVMVPPSAAAALRKLVAANRKAPAPAPAAGRAGRKLL